MGENSIWSEANATFGKGKSKYFKKKKKPIQFQAQIL